MKRIQLWVRAFFGFSRNETNAFLLLLPLMFLIVFIVPTYKAFFTSQEKDFTDERSRLDSLVANWREIDKKDSVPDLSRNLFAFDPNTASKEKLIDLGFAPALANRVENYRNKGGKFSIKSDLMKLYGMDTALYSKLYAWITLPIEKPAFKRESKSEFVPSNKLATEKFDLNQADSTQLISVYGIGSKLSARIIKYREKLGGFISFEQLKEVYGLDSTAGNELERKAYIQESFQPKAFDLNTAAEKELAAHPYIKYTLAKAITSYRFQHGSFKSIDELRQIAILDEPVFKKIKPYLSVNP
jgi:competence protein ComEA